MIYSVWMQEILKRMDRMQETLTSFDKRLTNLGKIEIFPLSWKLYLIRYESYYMTHIFSEFYFDLKQNRNAKSSKITLVMFMMNVKKLVVI